MHEATFSMLASNKTEFRDFNSFETKHGTLLKSALIYGANASGKTNLIKAMIAMRKMVLFSDNSEEIKNIEPFKFGTGADSTMFESSFIIEGVLYEYGFEIAENQILSEWLRKKSSRTTMILSRQGPHYNSIELKGELKEAEPVTKFIDSSALSITIMAKFNIHTAKLIKEYFSQIFIFSGESIPAYFTAQYISKDNVQKEEILKCLKYADFGIDDIEVDIEEQGVASIRNFLPDVANENYLGRQHTEKGQKLVTIDINTFNLVYDNSKQIVEKLKLPFKKYQSTGTLKFFEMLGPLLDTLKKGKVIIIDEIDARLHCALVRYILSLFNSIDSNPKNAQLICNTHDVLLLEENLRRDQIWFVQKNTYGESELYSLNDFNNVRKEDPILKKYLLGTYGAIPFLGKC
jgi:AAA15 family ATPase/GTPase